MAELAEIIDIIVVDGGSTDGSLNHAFLVENNVRALLTKQDQGKLSAQLRIGFAFALTEGYKGIITVDGNHKDSIASIPLFIRALKEGADFVQGSLYIEGGKEVNTPLVRKLAIKCIHAPFLSLLSGFRHTDTTNGFRAQSRKLLIHPDVQPFREVFQTYELLAYMCYSAPKKGLNVREIPVNQSVSRRQDPYKNQSYKGEYTPAAHSMESHAA